MEQLLNQFVKYVSEVTGQRITWGPRVSGRLPQYLAQSYGLYEIGIGRRRFLGVGVKEEAHFRPSSFIKHLGPIKPLDQPGFEKHQPNTFAALASSFTEYKSKS